MKKKVLAILLAAIMVMTLLPTVAFAEEITCPKCEGTGEVSGNCETCHGTGTVFGHCNTCDGQNTITCTDCAGSPGSGKTNSVQCEGCSGSGCSSCDYKGYICTTCSNEYRIDCPDCDGGEITCTACEGNRTITTPCPLCGGTKKVNASKITGTITAADFAYELVIPSETTLDESNYKDGVLLGSGDNAGLVTIEVTKHGADNVDVFYTVDLTNGNLTDGNNHTITTNYGISNAADGTFDALAANTEYTVYTAGAVKNTYIKVSANETSWNAAPVGDYNATLVFEFDDEEAKTVADLLPNDFPTAKIGSTWKKSGGSAALFVNVNNAQLYAEDGFTQSIELNTKLTPAGEGVYTCTGNQNETWTFTVENGKFTQVVIADLTSMQAELNGTYSKAE